MTECRNCGNIYEHDVRILEQTSGKYDHSKNNTHNTPKGKDHPQHILNESDIIQIRELYGMGGMSQRELGIQFGVCQQCIGDIIRGRTWGHI